MKYLYKNGKSYIYKRRVPNTKIFYTFNIGTKNAKKAYRVISKFNKLSLNLFEYLKKGKAMKLDLAEVFKVLDEYRDKALVENTNKLEDDRHNHLSELFGIEEEDPLLGTVVLNGADQEVIKIALKSFKNISLRSMGKNKIVVNKIGKQIVKRSTDDVKQLYKKLRNDDENLQIFLGLLLKTEAEILKTDYDRAEKRFNPNISLSASNVSNQNIENDKSFLDTQKALYQSLKDVKKEYLNTYCGYIEEDLKNSKTQAYKMDKIVQLFVDYIHYEKNDIILHSVSKDRICKVYNIIIDIPKKQGSTNKAYDYFYYYQQYKNKSYQKRSVSSIETDLLNYNRFIRYMEDKGYINTKDFKEIQQHYTNVKRDLKSAVKNGKIEQKKDVEAYKSEMIKSLFNTNNNPYKRLIDTFLGNKKIRKDLNIDDYWARYFVPLILFFTGARPSEIGFLKTDDCDIKVYENGKEKVVLFVSANDKKTIKTQSSKRIILVHDFLALDLGFINFIKKAQSENREYLFNTDRDVSELVGKEFNRKDIKKVCIEPFYTREDIFNNVKYSLYSFRHNYKTHMMFKKYNDTLVDKIQGHQNKTIPANYLSANSEELISFVNDFELYKTIDWSEFKKVSTIIF